MPVLNPVPSGNLATKDGQRTPSFGTFLQQVYDVLVTIQQSGTTANRPTRILWIGRRYFDTTLGIPIWVQSVNSSGVATWCDATGAAV